MNGKLLFYSGVVSVLISLGFVTGYHFLATPKIAYVRTGYVIAEYEGMKSANSLYEGERAKVQANMDTLRGRYDYLSALMARGGGNKQEVSARLAVAGDDYDRYSSTAVEQLEQRRGELLAGVIKEINSTIEAFGKKNGYRLILGATDAGSLLYGSPGDDVSSEVLQILNDNYKSQKK
jgi:outer membrane protein